MATKSIRMDKYIFKKLFIHNVQINAEFNFYHFYKPNVHQLSLKPKIMKLTEHLDYVFMWSNK